MLAPSRLGPHSLPTRVPLRSQDGPLKAEHALRRARAAMPSIARLILSRSAAAFLPPRLSCAISPSRFWTRRVARSASKPNLGGRTGRFHHFRAHIAENGAVTLKSAPRRTPHTRIPLPSVGRPTSAPELLDEDVSARENQVIQPCPIQSRLTSCVTRSGRARPASRVMASW